MKEEYLKLYRVIEEEQKICSHLESLVVKGDIVQSKYGTDSQNNLYGRKRKRFTLQNNSPFGRQSSEQFTANQKGSLLPPRTVNNRSHSFTNPQEIPNPLEIKRNTVHPQKKKETTYFKYQIHPDKVIATMTTTVTEPVSFIPRPAKVSSRKLKTVGTKRVSVIKAQKQPISTPTPEPKQKESEPKEKKLEQKPKNKKDKSGKSAFLLHQYPTGKGPDVELIEMLERDIIDRDPNITFEDIASLEKAKQILKETVLLPLLMPDYFQGVRTPRKGVLLFGPPGTGKTMLAKAVATFGKTTFFNVHASTLASKWKGDSEKLVRLLFEMARFYAPTTIFIDEIDSIASSREGKEDDSNRKVKSELLVQIDGVADTGEGTERKNIIVLGATNLPWDLDQAIIRRLDKRIYIPLPDNNARKELLKIMLKDENVDKGINWTSIVEKTVMFSGDDIKNLCRDAGMAPLRRLMLEGKIKNISEVVNKKEMLKNTPISGKDFLYALQNVKPSNTNSMLGQYSKWMKERGSS